MKNKHLIVSHPLLSNHHFFTPVNNEVAALVELAIFATVNPIILIK
jgi:hypothetical protein